MQVSRSILVSKLWVELKTNQPLKDLMVLVQDAKNSHPNGAPLVEILVLPKLGSSLQLILPLEGNYSDSKEGHIKSTKEDSTITKAVGFPDYVICIELSYQN